MRTINVKIVHSTGPGFHIEVETQEILESDDDAREAGRRAAHILKEVMTGVGDGGDEMGED